LSRDGYFFYEILKARVIYHTGFKSSGYLRWGKRLGVKRRASDYGKSDNRQKRYLYNVSHEYKIQNESKQEDDKQITIL